MSDTDHTIRANGNPALFYAATNGTLHHIDGGAFPDDPRELAILHALLVHATELAEGWR